MSPLSAWLWVLVPGMLLGLAIQRGSLCAVVAVNDIVKHSRWRRFWAIWQCPAWAWALSWLSVSVFATPITITGLTHHNWLWPLFGGALFGMGAWLNGGCAFGTVARLGQGEISFLVTLLAILAGQLCALQWLQHSAQISLYGNDMASSYWRWGWQLLLAMLLLISLRQAIKQRVWRWRVLRQPAWPAALAMPFVAGSATLVLLMHQYWPTTSIAASALSGQVQQPHRWGLLPAIIVGASLGALLGGNFALRWDKAGRLSRRVTGGMMMGLGSVLIPGGNSHLLVVGIPAQQISALLGYLSMMVCLFGLTLGSRYWSRDHSS